MPLSLRFRYMIKYNSKILTKALVPSSFDGYFTIHGECEMDGKRRIMFASSENSIRKKYIRETLPQHFCG